MKKLLPFLFALLLAPGISLAQQSGSYASSSAGSTQSRPAPDTILKMGIQDLQMFLNSDQSGNKEALVGLIRARIAPQFDIETLARWSGGYWYEQMNPEQKKAFTTKLAKSFSPHWRTLSAATRATCQRCNLCHHVASPRTKSMSLHEFYDPITIRLTFDSRSTSHPVAG